MPFALRQTMASGSVVSIMCIGLISGLYPAFFLAKFSPTDTLGGTYSKWGHGRFSKKNADHFPIRALHLFLLSPRLHCAINWHL